MYFLFTMLSISTGRMYEVMGAALLFFLVVCLLRCAARRFVSVCGDSEKKQKVGDGHSPYKGRASPPSFLFFFFFCSHEVGFLSIYLVAFSINSNPSLRTAIEQAPPETI